MPRQAKTLKELQDVWYAKLASKGFKDIEQPDQNLKVWSSHYSLQYDPDTYHAKARYYELAGQFLYDYKFKNKRQKLIWKMHSEGAFIVDIVTAITKLTGKGSKDGVVSVINTLAKEMLKSDTE